MLLLIKAFISQVLDTSSCFCYGRHFVSYILFLRGNCYRYEQAYVHMPKRLFAHANI